jgi:threonine dehydratase
MSAAAALPTFDDLLAARRRIASYVIETPSVTRDGVSYKLEFLQHTGSFKPRGAFNAALQLTSEERARGLVAVSGGNHGLAVAYVGHALGISATIVMPSTTPAFMVDRARRDGAEVLLTETIADAFAKTDELVSQGKTLLHPFDDARVIAGQATVGFEMLEQSPDADVYVASIGGGGLAIGIALAVKALKPSARVIGVETRGADAMRLALDAGKPVALPAITSIARTLGAPAVTERTLRGVQQFVDEVVVVDDRDAVAAIVELQASLGILVEPASACTLAALRLGLVRGSHPALLMCGCNIGLDEFAAWRLRFTSS